MVGAVFTWFHFAVAGDRPVKKQAVLVLGYIPSDVYQNTADQLYSDFEKLGYKTHYLKQPTLKALKVFLENPAVVAFGFVGEGSDRDSLSTDENDPETFDRIFINKNTIVTSSEMKLILKDRKMEKVLLHACYQGAKNNAVRWIKAFNVAKDQFLGWPRPAHYVEAFWWQLFW